MHRMSAGDGARPVAMDADHLGDPRHDPRPALIKAQTRLPRKPKLGPENLSTGYNLVALVEFLVELG